MILLCFVWAMVAVWFVDIRYFLQSLLFIGLVVVFAIEVKRWYSGPISVSIRGEKLYLHFIYGKVTPVEASLTRPHLLWIKMPSKGISPSIYLFRDSFTLSDWCSIQRCIRREIIGATSVKKERLKLW